MKVYVAFNSRPDYSSPSPTFKSLHETLEGAIESLYPGNERFQRDFRKHLVEDRWYGPDGYGMVRLMEVLK